MYIFYDICAPFVHFEMLNYKCYALTISQYNIFEKLSRYDMFFESS